MPCRSSPRRTATSANASCATTRRAPAAATIDFVQRLRRLTPARVDQDHLRLLIDDNDDGLFDRSTIFARDLSWPTGIAVWQDGIFVAATPDLWWLQDADRDGVAEKRERILTGFRKLNVQAVANNLLWTFDHRICGAGGTNGGLLAGAALPKGSPTPLTRAKASSDAHVSAVL